MLSKTVLNRMVTSKGNGTSSGGDRQWGFTINGREPAREVDQQWEWTSSGGWPAVGAGQKWGWTSKERGWPSKRV